MLGEISGRRIPLILVNARISTKSFNGWRRFPGTIRALLDRFDEIALAGPVEWTRSNKHTGVRHMPVALRRR